MRQICRVSRDAFLKFLALILSLAVASPAVHMTIHLLPVRFAMRIFWG